MPLYTAAPQPSTTTGTSSGTLLDRLTHHVHILELNGESFRLIQSKKKRAHSLG